MAINITRRRTVMARSQKLGHCVCNPRQGCPCDTLKAHNVCPCAGERMPPKAERVALTRHVQKAGCASKIGQADLARVLGKLPQVNDPRVLLGVAAGDDAAIYRLDDERSLVQTVDVFTPCVDDPYLFGKIAAANSVSDVYAMGGTPLTALSIVGFPIDELDGAAMEAMLRGGIEKLSEAGCSLIGGHSINDPEIKCGFAVTGLIETAKVVVRDNAKVGDCLVLTKPLGTGMLSFAAQIGRLRPECLDEAGAWMAALNKDAAELMVELHAHACTDVTGFGLAGHLVEMARKSRVTAIIDLEKLPVFAAAQECLEADILGGAIERNQEYAMAWVEAESPEAEKLLPVLYDPQTSGGLLIALPEKEANAMLKKLKRRGNRAAAIVGEIVANTANVADGKVLVRGKRLGHLVGTSGGVTPRAGGDSTCCAGASPCAASTPEPVVEPLCCAKPPAFVDDAPGNALASFGQFMGVAIAPGKVDARTKELIAIALSIARQCEPCLRSHLTTAFGMGLSRAEIDEAAALAVEFAGCPALMFYKETLRKLQK
jgi:selenide,water dikinase